MEAESHSASQSAMEKPPNTPEMSVHNAEAMANDMLLDSPLPNLERGNDEIPEGDGSGTDEQPGKTPAGKLVTPCRKGIFLLLLK